MQPVMQAPPRLPHPPPEPLAPPLLPPRLPPLAPLPLKKIPPSPRKCPPWTKNSARSSKTRAATGPSTCTALTQDEEIAINADQPMVSASLIKLYIAGCYLERVKKGKLDDNYDYQLFKMLSESDNGATNTLIDVLGMDRINRFMKKHHFKAGKLNRKMLVQNGTEADCGKVLREVYNWDYVNPDSSARVMRALWAQIPRNRQKIPAGVPSDIETANKTGELYTHDQNGTGITVQNDAAVIFAPGHPYILVVMTAVPGGGEGQLHREIAGLSAQVYEAICGTNEEEAETGESAVSGGTAQSGESAVSGGTAQSGEGAATGSTGNK